MRCAIVIAATLAVAGATAGRAAYADESDDVAEAKKLAARAQVHFDLGEYGLAIVAYRDAYRLHPRPGLIYNLAQAYRLSGDCVNATVMYRNYLRLAPRSSHRSIARQHISALAECNRKHTGWTEVDDGFVDAAHGTGGANEKRTASLVIAGATDRQSDGGESRPGRRRKVAGVGFAGVGGALLLGGAYMMLRADATADEVSRRYADGDDWEDIEPLDRRGQREERTGTALLVAGGAALVTGATLYALGWREERRASAVSVVPVGKGAAVSVSWGF